MKKLLIIALVAISAVSIADARKRCGTKSCAAPMRECAPKKCAPRCVEKVNCIRPACVVGCENSFCEGEKPSICALEPARVDVIKHVDTNVWYDCAPKKDCQVIPTQEQVDALIAQGSVPAGTEPCTH